MPATSTTYREHLLNRLHSCDVPEHLHEGLIEYVAGRRPTGRLNGSFEPLPTGRDLIQYWRDRLPEGERRIFDVLVDYTGSDVARDDLDEATGYKKTSRDQYLVRLRARGLVEFSARGVVRASAELFQ